MRVCMSALSVTAGGCIVTLIIQNYVIAIVIMIKMSSSNLTDWQSFWIHALSAFFTMWPCCNQSPVALLVNDTEKNMFIKNKIQNDDSNLHMAIRSHHCSCPIWSYHHSWSLHEATEQTNKLTQQSMRYGSSTCSYHLLGLGGMAS